LLLCFDVLCKRPLPNPRLQRFSFMFSLYSSFYLSFLSSSLSLSLSLSPPPLPLSLSPSLLLSTGPLGPGWPWLKILQPYLALECWDYRHTPCLASLMFSFEYFIVLDLTSQVHAPFLVNYFFKWDWGLNSGPHACKAWGALLLQPHL
jgi:hypothetical protein